MKAKILQHNEKMETDSLTMVTVNTPEKATDNKQTTISTPINTPIFQHMSLTNLVVNQQEQVHIQTQVQEYERKDAMSTRVIDETTLRIYFPRTPEVTATIPSVSASSLLHSTATTFILVTKIKVLLISKVRLCY